MSVGHTRPTGTVTFLFSDIEGSTRLWKAHPETMKVALAEHDTIVRSAIESVTGYVFSTSGDAFLGCPGRSPNDQRTYDTTWTAVESADPDFDMAFAYAAELANANSAHRIGSADRHTRQSDRRRLNPDSQPRDTSRLRHCRATWGTRGAL